LDFGRNTHLPFKEEPLWLVPSMCGETTHEPTVHLETPVQRPIGSAIPRECRLTSLFLTQVFPPPQSSAENVLGYAREKYSSNPD
jgi:hypothetical protein